MNFEMKFWDLLKFAVILSNEWTEWKTRRKGFSLAAAQQQKQNH